MENKPNLVLTEKDLLEGARNSSRNFAIKFKADLITVLEYMIKNKKSLNIDLSKYECGTYRCVAGWWAHWVGMCIECSIDYDELDCDFEDSLAGIRIWRGFRNKRKFLYKFPFIFKISNRLAIFGGNTARSLERRLELAKALKIK